MREDGSYLNGFENDELQSCYERIRSFIREKE